jgi:hypothetical protein
MSAAAKAACQKHLDTTYGEGAARLLTEPAWHYGEWIALVAIGANGPLVRMAFGSKPKQLELSF